MTREHDPMDEIGTLLSAVMFAGGIKCSEATRHDIPGHWDHVLYTYEQSFVLVKWASGSGRYDDPWSDAGVRVHVVLAGEVPYPEDGVRHMHVGEDGYLHYPNPRALAAALLLINDLFAINRNMSEGSKP